MNKYIYLWLEKGREISEGVKPEYLYFNFGVNLASEYMCSHKWNGSLLKVSVIKNQKFEANFYSEYVNDIKVLVGNNGAGKTTLLNHLYYLIAYGFGELNSNFGKYALVYLDDTGSLCTKTNLSHENISFETKLSVSTFYDEKKHTAKLAIRYTTSFDDQERKSDDFIQHGNLKRTSDLTTNGLIFSDKEIANNFSTIVKYNQNIESLDSFYQMENNRKIDFITAFSGKEVQHFWKCYNLPREIVVQPSYVNICNAISEIVQKLMEEFEVGDIIRSELTYLSSEEFEKWAEYKNVSGHTPQELYGDAEIDELKKAVEKSYQNYYKKLGLVDKFRFAIMMSYYRTYSNENLPFFVDMPISKFPQLENSKKNDLLKDIPLWEEGMLCEYKKNIELIVDIVEKKNNSDDFIILELDSESLAKIAEINKKIFKLTPFLSFDFKRPLSSGEAALLKFYSRLYYALSNQAEGENASEIHLFLDEVDAYLHPEWQRQWLWRFLNGLKYFNKVLMKNKKITKSLNFQIFMATHSPFMATDFLQENIVLLKRRSIKSGTKVIPYKLNRKNANCFCANIYDLMDSGFFLENTIGLFAEKKVCDFLKKKNQKKLSLLKTNKTFLSIGDPVLKSLVYESLEGDSFNDKN